MKITNFDIIKKNVQKNLSNIKHWTITKVCSIRHNYESKFALLYSEMQINNNNNNNKRVGTEHGRFIKKIRDDLYAESW